MKTQQLAIEGMSCGHCVMHVQKALSKVDGLTIEKVEIGTARVQVDESLVTNERLTRAVEEAGYKVVSIS